MADQTYQWTCTECDHTQTDIITDDGPSMVTLCEDCGAGHAIDWDNVQ